jgi:hypothetical protein
MGEVFSRFCLGSFLGGLQEKPRFPVADSMGLKRPPNSQHLPYSLTYHRTPSSKYKSIYQPTSLTEIILIPKLLQEIFIYIKKTTTIQVGSYVIDRE